MFVEPTATTIVFISMIVLYSLVVMSLALHQPRHKRR